MTSFSHVKALEQEIADLKAEVVYLSGMVTNDAEESERGGEQDWVEAGLLHTSLAAALLGLAAGWFLRGRRA